MEQQKQQSKKGVVCLCPCRQIITEINPHTNKPYSRCKASRDKQAADQSKQRNENMKTKFSQSKGIYNSAAWRRLSHKKLTLTPFCEECTPESKIDIMPLWERQRSQIVDHIKEVRDDPKLAYRWDNLRALCRRCHNRKTAEEAAQRANDTNGKKKMICGDGDVIEYV